MRFGYDVSRMRGVGSYQRIFLRGGPAGREPRLATRAPPANPSRRHIGEEEDEDETPLAAARSSVVPHLASQRTRHTTNLFRRNHLPPQRRQLQLCDIHDTLIHHPTSCAATRPGDGGGVAEEQLGCRDGLVHEEGVGADKALVTARFKALVDRARRWMPRRWKVRE